MYYKFDNKALLFNGCVFSPHGVVPFLKYATGCSACVCARACV